MTDPIIIPAGLSRDEITECYFCKKISIPDSIQALKNLKEEVKKNNQTLTNSQTGGDQTWERVFTGAFNSVGRPILRLASIPEPVQEVIKVSLATLIQQGTLNIRDIAINPRMIAGIIAAGACAYWRGGEEAIKTGMMEAIRKIGTATTISYVTSWLGSAIGAYFSGGTPAGATGGGQIGGWAGEGAGYILMCWSAVNVVSIGVNQTMTGGNQIGGAVDDRYFEDMKKQTEGAEEILKELEKIMGKKDYEEFLSGIISVFASKPRAELYTRVFDIKDYYTTLGFLIYYLLAGYNQNNKTRNNNTKKIKNKKNNNLMNNITI